MSVPQMNASIQHVSLDSICQRLLKLTSLRKACPNVACKDIKDSSSGSNLAIQRYLAYNAFINLSNFFEVMITQLLNAANNGLGISTTIATVSGWTCVKLHA